jgi:hypothetical protein
MTVPNQLSPAQNASLGTRKDNDSADNASKLLSGQREEMSQLLAVAHVKSLLHCHLTKLLDCHRRNSARTIRRSFRFPCLKKVKKLFNSIPELVLICQI